MELVLTRRNCAYDFTDANITAIQNSNSTNGYLAVSLVDNETDEPTPKVNLCQRGFAIYGVVVAVNTTTKRCTVVTKGIVPTRGHIAPYRQMQGYGIIGFDNGQTRFSPDSNGNPTVGTGTIIGYESGSANNITWVDLNINANVAVP